MLGRFAPGIRRADGPGQVTGDVRQKCKINFNTTPFMHKVITTCLILLGILHNISAAALDEAVQVQIECAIDGLDISKLLDVSENQRSFSSGNTVLPRVTTKFDQEARVVTIRELRHPISFSAPDVPKDWKTSDLGVTLRIKPSKQKNGAINYYGSLTVASAPDLKDKASSKSEIPTILQSTKWFSGEAASGEPVKLTFFTPEGKKASFTLVLTKMNSEGKQIE
jgi:hypothetical protein